MPDDTEMAQHFEILCVSFGLSLYDVTKSLNWIPASTFLARRSRLLKMMMKVIPARSPDLHIVLQSWNESNWDGSYQITRDDRTRLTSLFTDVSVIVMSNAGHFGNKGGFTFVEDLIKCGQGHDKYDDGHFKML